MLPLNFHLVLQEDYFLELTCVYIFKRQCQRDILYYVKSLVFRKKWLDLIEEWVNNPSCWIWVKAGHLELLVKNKNMTPLFGSFMLQMLHLRRQHWNTEKHVGFIESLSMFRLSGPCKSKCHFWNTSFTSPSAKQTTFRKVPHRTKEV